MSMLDGEWAKAVGDEFRKPYYRDLYNFVKDEYSRATKELTYTLDILYIHRLRIFLMQCILHLWIR